MKVKKLLSALTALAMTLSFGAIQAFAGGDPPADPPTESEQFVGVGDIIYTDTEEPDMKVASLPTDLAWDFLIDPQGLSALLPGDVFKPENLGQANQTIKRLLDEDGEYDFENGTLQDKTGVDLSPTVIFKDANAAGISHSGNAPLMITATVGEKADGEATFVANTEAFDDDPDGGIENEIFIQLVASTLDIGDENFVEETFSGTIGRAVKDGATPTAIKFLIENSEYAYKVESVEPFITDYIMVNEDEVHGTYLVPDAAVNFDADWSDFATIYDENGDKTDPSMDVAITVEFAVAVASDAEIAASEAAGTGVGTINANAYGLVNTATAADNIGNTPAITAPLTPIPEENGGDELGFAEDTGTAKVNAWTRFAFNPGETTISKVTANGTTLTTSGASAYTYVEADGELSLRLASTGTKTIVVTMADTTTYTFTLNVTA